MFGTNYPGAAYPAQGSTVVAQINIAITSGCNQVIQRRTA